MTRSLIILLTFITSLTFFAQRNLNNALKTRIDEKNLPQEFTLLVQGNIPKLQQAAKSQNFRLNYSAGDIASLTLNIASLSYLLEQQIISYAEFIEPQLKPLNDTMLLRNRIIDVKNGVAPVPAAFTGTGVVVGIIDTGIDWQHPDFKDASGNTRIKFLWDQNVNSGSTVPQPYNYGIEWTAAQINASVCTHNDLANYGHGTHVSGIAAGNGNATGTHEGCAPNSDLVVVAVKFNHPGPKFADAVQYIYSKATALGKPCVINASVGSYIGSHDGTDLEAKLIENMMTNVPGRVLVAAAGNAGSIKYHVKTNPPLNDTTFTWLKKTGIANHFYYSYADTNQIKNIQISVGANRTNYSDLGRTGFKPYNYGLAGIQIDTLKNNGNRIGIIKTSASINNYGVYELLIRIYPDSADLLWRVESKGNGLYHSWNFDLVSTALPNTSQYPAISKYSMPDTLYTIVSSFQCLDDVITVANYNNLSNYYDVNNTLQSTGVVGGSRALSSSIGPTRDGRFKPDITATGDYVFSAMPLGMAANLIANAPSVVAQGSMHVQGGGTSAASPVVAGFAALYLEFNPTITSGGLRYVVTNCGSYSDNFTGTNLPNAHWGYGKLDGKGAITCIVTGKEELLKNNSVNIYPNPFSENVKISFNIDINGELSLYSIDGRLLLKKNVAGNSVLISREETGNYSGVLLGKITGENRNLVFKLISTE